MIGSWLSALGSRIQAAVRIPLTTVTVHAMLGALAFQECSRSGLWAAPMQISSRGKKRVDLLLRYIAQHANSRWRKVRTCSPTPACSRVGARQYRGGERKIFR